MPRSLGTLGSSYCIAKRSFCNVRTVSSDRCCGGRASNGFAPVLSVRSPMRSVSGLFAVDTSREYGMRIARYVCNGQGGDFRLPLYRLISCYGGDNYSMCMNVRHSIKGRF